MSETGKSPPSAVSRRLDVLRIKEGEAHRVIAMSSGRVRGFQVHYVKKHGTPCQGTDCTQCRAGVRSIWKGYTPVLWLDEKPQVWWPRVLEVTESLELDFRDRLEMGHLWKLFRIAATKPGQQPPIVGRLESSKPRPLVGRTFDPLPAVHVIYHDYNLRLVMESPLPPRLVVDPISMGEVDPEKAAAEAPPVDRPKLADAFKKRGLNVLNGIGNMPKGGVE